MRTDSATVHRSNRAVTGLLIALAVLAFGWLATMPAPANAAPADPDTAFGTDGIVSTDIGFNAYGGDAVFQPDGKLVAVGSTANGFAVARFNVNGSPDTAFNFNGAVTTSSFSGGLAWADLSSGAVALQSDGKIVIAGVNSVAGTDGGFAVARYNANGTLDTSFGASGTKEFTIPGTYGSSFVNGWPGMAIQADGKIVVGGNSGGNLAAARLTSAGNLDSSFDGDGHVSTAFPSSMTPSNDGSIAIQPDGKIVVVSAGSDGISGNSCLMGRYNSNGSLDTSFDSDGTLASKFGFIGISNCRALAQADGKLVIAASTADDNWAVARLHSNGALDPAFSSDGIQVLDGGGWDYIRDAILQPDGKIVAAGAFDDQPGVFVARFTQAGDLDPAFGSGGQIAAISPDSYTDAVAIRGDGRIGVAGSGRGQKEGALVAHVYSSSGAPDSSFGGGGSAEISFTGSQDTAEAAVFQPDGKLVVAGSNSEEFSVLRYADDGSLDPTFNNGKPSSFSFWTGDTANAVGLDSSGRILTAGNGGGRFTLLRFTAAGQHDWSFDGDSFENTIATSFGGGVYATARAMHVWPDNKLIVVGEGDGRVALAKYNADGTLDTTFDGDGKLLTNTGAYVRPIELAVQSNGKIIVVGRDEDNFKFVVLRYTASGALDTTFNSDGIVDFDFGTLSDPGDINPSAISVRPDGTVVIAGCSDGKLSLARLTATGVLDSTFSGDGRSLLTTSPSVARCGGVAQDAASRLVLAGDDFNDFIVARMNVDGALTDSSILDPTFGSGGLRVVDLGASPSTAKSVAVRTDGKIAVAGSSGGDITVIRLLGTFTGTGGGTGGGSSGGSGTGGGGTGNPGGSSTPPAGAPSITGVPKSVLATKAVHATVSCPAGCKVRIILKIGKKSYPLPSRAVSPSAQPQAVSFKIPKRLATKIKVARKKKAKVSLVLTPIGTTTNGTSVSIRVK